ncbi:hypothetical protein ACFE04_020777 [Oxalis oulophora]
MATSTYKNLRKLFKTATAIKKTSKASVKSSSSRIPLAKDKELKHFFSSSTSHHLQLCITQTLQSLNTLIVPLFHLYNPTLKMFMHYNPSFSGSLSLDQINDEKPLEKILDNPWYPSTSSDQMSIMRKTMTRDKKRKWIHKNTQGYCFDQLFNRCVQSLGTDTTIETFGRLGRETGEKKYNAIIKRCIEQAKLCDSDDESLDKFMKAYKIFKGIKEQGFAIQEGDSSKFPRLGYYEMLMWFKLGDLKKIHELCDILVVNDLLAFCESDQRAELLQILNVVDITHVSSSCSASIFKALERLSLDSFDEKFIFALKTSELPLPKYVAELHLDEDAILEFKNFYMKLDLAPSSASFEALVTYCCHCWKVHQALDLVDEMREAGLTLTLDMMHTILTASANLSLKQHCNELRRLGLDCSFVKRASSRTYKEINRGRNKLIHWENMVIGIEEQFKRIACCNTRVLTLKDERIMWSKKTSRSCGAGYTPWLLRCREFW